MCPVFTLISSSAASSKSEGSQQWPEHVSKRAEEKKDVARPGRPVVRDVAQECGCVWDVCSLDIVLLGILCFLMRGWFAV